MRARASASMAASSALYAMRSVARAAPRKTSEPRASARVAVHSSSADLPAPVGPSKTSNRGPPSSTSHTSIARCWDSRPKRGGALRARGATRFAEDEVASAVDRSSLSCGDFRSSPVQSSSHTRGTDGTSARSSGGSEVTWARSTASVAPTKGGRPASTSKMVQPSAYASDSAEGAAPRRRSGAR